MMSKYQTANFAFYIHFQTVDIFKENVARREIGVLTTGSIRLRTQKKALPPNGPEPLRVYRRIPISYTRLDKLGHSHWERNKTVSVCIHISYCSLFVLIVFLIELNYLVSEHHLTDAHVLNHLHSTSHW